MTPVKNHCDCYFVKSYQDQVMLQWSHLVIFTWPSIGDSWSHHVFSYEMSNQIRAQRSPMLILMVIHIWIFYCEATISAEVTRLSHFAATWKIIKNNDHCDSTIESPIDGDMRMTKWLHFNVTWITRHKTNVKGTTQWSQELTFNWK